MPNSLISALVGEHLSSIEFVADYVQIRFNGPYLNAFTVPSIRVGNAEFHYKELGYLEALISCIDKVVSAANITANEINIDLQDHGRITISLRPEDLHGPEAAFLNVGSESEVWP